MHVISLTDPKISRLEQVSSTHTLKRVSTSPSENTLQRATTKEDNTLKRVTHSSQEDQAPRLIRTESIYPTLDYNQSFSSVVRGWNHQTKEKKKKLPQHHLSHHNPSMLHSNCKNGKIIGRTNSLSNSIKKMQMHN